MSFKKKVLAFLGIILLLATPFSCVFENGEKTTEDTEKTTDDDSATADDKAKTGFITTTFTSSTLAIPGALPSSLKGKSQVKNISGDYTPPLENVSGVLLSLLFTIDNSIDDGLVVHGYPRPDDIFVDLGAGNFEPVILLPFDLDEETPISQLISDLSIKPGFLGGTSSNMLLVFGYVDFTFTVNSESRVIRLATAPVTINDDNEDPSDDRTYERGDLLLKDVSTGEFKWYDNDNEDFTEDAFPDDPNLSRPPNPCVIQEIASYEDTVNDGIRDNMVHYPFNVPIKEQDPNDQSLTVPSSINIPDENGLNSATGIIGSVDFIVTDAVVIEGYSSLSGISDPDLITHFNLSQNFFGYGESGLGAFATFIVSY